MNKSKKSKNMVYKNKKHEKCIYVKNYNSNPKEFNIEFNTKINNAIFRSIHQIDEVSLTDTNRSTIIKSLENAKISNFNNNLYGFETEEKLKHFIVTNIDNIYCYNFTSISSMACSGYIVYKTQLNNETLYIRICHTINLYSYNNANNINIYNDFKSLLLDKNNKHLIKSIEEIQLKLTGDKWWKDLNTKIELYKCYDKELNYLKLFSDSNEYKILYSFNSIKNQDKIWNILLKNKILDATNNILYKINKLDNFKICYENQNNLTEEYILEFQYEDTLIYLLIKYKDDEMYALLSNNLSHLIYNSFYLTKDNHEMLDKCYIDLNNFCNFQFDLGNKEIKGLYNKLKSNGKYNYKLYKPFSKIIKNINI